MFWPCLKTSVLIPDIPTFTMLNVTYSHTKPHFVPRKPRIHLLHTCNLITATLLLFLQPISPYLNVLKFMIIYIYNNNYYYYFILFLSLIQYSICPCTCYGYLPLPEMLFWAFFNLKKITYYNAHWFTARHLKFCSSYFSLVITSIK